AVYHYFDGKIYLPFLFLPLLLPALLTCIGCAVQLFCDIKNIRQKFLEILIFLAFVEYYLFLPGAITAPRYQIPALPFAVTLAATGLFYLWEIISRILKKQSKKR
ncbi:MAG: hypothetical protein IKA32_06965, partial [Lentisphaeria bacterium]|nr:hypothetical protein [Lentisphaeria bacterium]